MPDRQQRLSNRLSLGICHVSGDGEALVRRDYYPYVFGARFRNRRDFGALLGCHAQPHRLARIDTGDGEFAAFVGLSGNFLRFRHARTAIEGHRYARNSRAGQRLPSREDGQEHRANYSPQIAPKSARPVRGHSLERR